jgi:hypothetical protein
MTYQISLLQLLIIELNLSSAKCPQAFVIESVEEKVDRALLI